MWASRLGHTTLCTDCSRVTCKLSEAASFVLEQQSPPEGPQIIVTSTPVSRCYS